MSDKKTPAKPADKSSPKPRRPPAGHLERTHIETIKDPSTVMQGLKEVLAELDVYFNTDGKYKIKCKYYPLHKGFPSGTCIEFRLELFEKAPGIVVLEVQRRWGERVAFYKVYHALWDAAAKRKLVVAHPPSRIDMRPPVLDKEEPLTEEQICTKLKYILIMAGSYYIKTSLQAVEILCCLTSDAKIAAWLVKNGYIKLANSAYGSVSWPAVTWIANMAQSIATSTDEKELCEKLCEKIATTETLTNMAQMLESKCEQVVREASRALENLSAVLGPKKILSAAKISDAMAQRMANSSDWKIKASWEKIMGKKPQ